MLLAGCLSGLTKTQIVEKETKVPYAVPVEIFCPTMDYAKGTELVDVAFVEIEDGDKVWWIALSPAQYERLSRNTADLERYRNEQARIISYYKKCIEKSKEKVDIPEVN